MDVLRGIAGLFLSGLLPMVVALMAESLPSRRRGTYISMAFTAYTAGSVAGGIVAVKLLEQFGWRSVFIVGGVVPLLLLPCVLRAVPESVLFLAASGASATRLKRGLARMSPGTTLLPGILAAVSPVPRRAGMSAVADLFAGELRWKTVCMWAATFLSMGSIALLAAWMPTFFQEMAGISIERFALVSLGGFLGGAAGTLLSGWLLDRPGATLVGPGYYVGLAAALLLLGWGCVSPRLFITGLVLFYFFQSGGQAVLNVLMARMYATPVRSMGIGWSGGWGRLGGVVVPLFGGVALNAGWSIGITMTLIAAVPLGVVVCLFLLRTEPRFSASRPAPLPAGR